MKMYNLTTEEITIRGEAHTFVLPPSMEAGQDGPAVDLTLDFPARVAVGDQAVLIAQLMAEGKIRFDHPV